MLVEIEAEAIVDQFAWLAPKLRGPAKRRLRRKSRDKQADKRKRKVASMAAA